MGIAASFIAQLLNRFRWIAYVGLAIILYVALHMIFEGTSEIHEAVAFGQLLRWPVWVAFRPDLLAEFGAGNAGPASALAEAPIFRPAHSTAHG
jgi:predicted tellurium resistance membrane protein TerC